MAKEARLQIRILLRNASTIYKC